METGRIYHHDWLEVLKAIDAEEFGDFTLDLNPGDRMQESKSPFISSCTDSLPLRSFAFFTRPGLHTSYLVECEGNAKEKRGKAKGRQQDRGG